MSLTTATSLERKQPFENKFIWLLVSIFLVYWVFGWFYNHNTEDWIIENLLVIILIPVLFISRRWHRFSDLSYLFLFLFVTLHCYGAFYAYTHNALGEWLRTTYHLWRNPYDRIVHFSFGLFIAYPAREILLNKFKVSPRIGWLLPIEIAFSLGTVFEMIEWGVAECTSKETGETYVATQGDVWDAHKDIAMAALGAAVTMLTVYIFKRLRKVEVDSR
jgi:putative membrane protein